MSNDEFFDRLGDFLNRSTRALKDRLTLDVTDLLRAVDANDPDAVERVLFAGVDPNRDDGIGRYALPIACDNNNTIIVRMLLKAGASPNQRDRKGISALYKAVYWENAEIVQMLLRAGADVHLANPDSVTPVEEAKRSNYKAILELLEGQQTANKAQRKEVDRARHEAMKAKAEEARRRKAEAEQHRVEMAKRKAEIEQRKAQESQEKLLQRKYDVQDNDYDTALIQAIKDGDNESARIFLEKVEDINIINEQHQTTALMAAMTDRNTEMTKLLIEHGADITIVVAPLHHSALTYAVSQGHSKLVDFMLQKTADDALDDLLNDREAQLSPQFIAYKDPKMLDLLLSAGADPFFGGTDALSPVVKAIEKASLAVLPVFIKHQVDLDALTEGKTPLEWAIHYRRKNWLIGLLDEGVNPDFKNTEGNTPLMLATAANMKDFVEILLEENADPTLTNNDGKTALDIAEALGEEGKEVADLLR